MQRIAELFQDWYEAPGSALIMIFVAVSALLAIVNGIGSVALDLLGF